jgi:hypothetical protein
MSINNLLDASLTIDNDDFAVCVIKQRPGSSESHGVSEEYRIKQLGILEEISKKFGTNSDEYKRLSYSVNAIGKSGLSVRELKVKDKVKLRKIRKEEKILKHSDNQRVVDVDRRTQRKFKTLNRIDHTFGNLVDDGSALDYVPTRIKNKQRYDKYIVEGSSLSMILRDKGVKPESFDNVELKKINAFSNIVREVKDFQFYVMPESISKVDELIDSRRKVLLKGWFTDKVYNVPLSNPTITHSSERKRIRDLKASLTKEYEDLVEKMKDKPQKHRDAVLNKAKKELDKNIKILSHQKKKGIKNNYSSKELAIVKEKPLSVKGLKTESGSSWSTYSDMMSLLKPILEIIPKEVLKYATSFCTLLYQLYRSRNTLDVIASLQAYASSFGQNVIGLLSYSINKFSELWDHYKFSLKAQSGEFINTIDSWFSIIWESKLATSLHEVVVRLAGLHFFNKDIAILIKEHIGRPVRCTTMELFKNMLVLAKTIMEYYHLLKSGVPILSIFESENPIATYLTDIKLLRMNENLLYSGLPVSGKMYALDFVKKSEAALAVGKELSKGCKKGAPLYFEMEKEILLLQKTALDVKLSLDSGMRQMPFGILITGAPEIGKARLVDMVAHIWNKVKGRTPSSDMIFHRVTTSQYWEGYSPYSHPVIHYPELGNMTPSYVAAHGDPMILELGSIMDSLSRSVDMAFDQKGKCFCLAELVIIDSNKPDLNLDKAVYNTAATRRRFIELKFTPKNEFLKRDSASIDVVKSLNSADPIMDRWVCTIVKYHAKSATDVRQEILQSNKDIYDTTATLVDLFKDHISKQDTFSKRLDDEGGYDSYMPKEPNDNGDDDEKNSLHDIMDKFVLWTPKGCRFAKLYEEEAPLILAGSEPTTAIINEIIDYYFVELTDEFVKFITGEIRNDYYTFLSTFNTESGKKLDIPETITEENLTEPDRKGILVELNHVYGRKRFPDTKEFKEEDAEIDSDSSSCSDDDYEGLIDTANCEKLPKDAYYSTYKFIQYVYSLYPTLVSYTVNNFAVAWWISFKVNLYYLMLYYMANMALTFAEGILGSGYASVITIMLIPFVYTLLWLPAAPLTVILFLTLMCVHIVPTVMIQSVKSYVVNKQLYHYKELKSLFSIDGKYTRRASKCWQENSKAILLSITAAGALVTAYKYFSSRTKVEEEEYFDDREEILESYTAEQGISKPLSEVEDFIRASRSYEKIPIKGQSNLWNTREINVKDVSHKGTLEELALSMSRSIRKVLVVQKNRTIKTHILGVKSNLALINTHAIKCDGDITIRVCSMDNFDSSQITNDSILDPDRIVHLNNDVSMISLSSMQFKDKVHHFTDGILDKLKYKGYFIDETLEVNKINQNVLISDTNGNFELNQLLRYRYPDHYPGACGQPLYIYDGNGVTIAGFHTAAKDGDEFGYATIFSRAEIVKAIATLEEKSLFALNSESEHIMELLPASRKSMMNFIPLHGIEYLGRVPGDILTNKKSNLIKDPSAPSIRKAFVDKGFEITKEFGIPKMKPETIDGVYINPVNIGISPMAVQKGKLDHRIVKKAVKAYVDHVYEGLKARGVPDLSPLNFHTAINGDPLDPYLKRINVQTAAGFGFKGKKKNFLPIISDDENGLVRGMTPELQARVEEIFECYRNGKTAGRVISACLKDEAREVAKCKSGRTRLFYCSPLDVIIVSRVLTSSIYTLMVQHSDLFGGALGIDMHRDSHDLIMKKIMWSLFHMEGDFKYYDVSMCFDISWAVAAFTYELAKKMGYSDDALLMLRGYLSDTLFSHVEAYNDVWKVPGIQTSGGNSTAETNTARTNLMKQIFWFTLEISRRLDFFKCVKSDDFGDDLNSSVKQEAIGQFNNVTFQKFCKEHLGMTFTSSLKTDEMKEYLYIEECTFLKRNFVYDGELQRWKAPLDISSIVRSLEWYTPSKVLPIHEHRSFCLVSAMWELTLHLNRSDWLDLTNKLREIFDSEYGIEGYVNFPTYDSIRSSMYGDMIPDNNNNLEPLEDGSTLYLLLDEGETKVSISDVDTLNSTSCFQTDKDSTRCL